MTRKDLFGERCSRPRHPDDKDRKRRRVSDALAKLEPILIKHVPDTLESLIDGPCVVCNLAAFEGIALQPLLGGFNVPAKVVISLAQGKMQVGAFANREGICFAKQAFHLRQMAVAVAKSDHFAQVAPIPGAAWCEPYGLH